MRWVGQVEHIGKLRYPYKILVGMPEGTVHSGVMGIDERKILK
jgi:hypothetical protein